MQKLLHCRFVNYISLLQITVVSFINQSGSKKSGPKWLIRPNEKILTSHKQKMKIDFQLCLLMLSLQTVSEGQYNKFSRT